MTDASGLRGRTLAFLRPHVDLRSLLTFAPSPPRRWVGVRAAVVVGLPLVVAWSAGHPTAGFLASLGGWAVLYGTAAAIRHRARVIGGVGAGLFLCAVVGVLTAGHVWLSLAAMVATTSAASWILYALRVGAPSGFFFALTTGVSGLAVTGGQRPALVLGMTAVGAVLALLVGTSDLLTSSHGVEREAVKHAAREVERFAAGGADSDQDRLRASASAALHAAWTAVNDGRARARYEEELHTVHQRYAAVTAYLSSRQFSQEVHPWDTDIEGAERAPLGPGSGFGRTGDERRRVEATQVRQSSLGRPAAAYLLRQAAWWPSESLLVAARVLAATAVAGAIATAWGNEHVYWAVAFAALIVNTGGSRRVQATKALHRIVGTSGGLLLFALTLRLDLRGWWLIGIVVLLQWAVEVLVTRHYALAVTFLTPLALIISAEVTAMPTATVVGDRVLDTAIGVGTALVVLMVSGLGGHEIVLRAHARRVALAVAAVLGDLVEGRHTTPEGEQRRQHLYVELLDSDNVARRALADAPGPVAPYRDMERLLSDVGYLVLGAAWHDDVAADRGRFVRAGEALGAVTGRPLLRRRTAAEITDELRRVKDVLTAHRTWGE